MSGILDSKARIIDAIITQEGRRQIAEGDLRIEYVSFTDTGTRYAADLVSGSADASARIFLEACNLPQDQIAFEADDSGRLQPFKNGQGTQLKDGQIVDYSFTAVTSSLITGSLENVTFLKGDEFSSQADSLLASSLDNFSRLQLIATHDQLFEDDGFGLSRSSVNFVIHNTRPINNPNLFTAHVDQIESLFNDPRLSHVKNFKFLPPINKVHDKSVDKGNHKATSHVRLGEYRPWGRTAGKLEYNQLLHELRYYSEQGYGKTINIDPTSKNNRIVAQFFEKTYNQLRKLDVIDYGLMRTYDRNHPIAHVFFVGKVVTDSNETNSFVHLFTLLFE